MTTAASPDAFPDTPNTDPSLGGHNAGREPGVIRRAGQRVVSAIVNFADGIDPLILASARSPRDYYLPRPDFSQMQERPTPETQVPPAPTI